MLLLFLFFAPPLKAQVTIGKDTVAHKFSVLELRTDQLKGGGGLRMPQLSTTDRETLLKSSKDSIDAKGLWIYNTTDNCLEFWNGTKWIGMCSDAEPYYNTMAPDSVGITTFTNVMYDFQHQTLQAYYSGGIPTKYEWQVSTDSVTFTDIQDAPNSNFYTVPAHYADNYQKDGIDSLFFRCILSNPQGSTTTAGLNILFINTSTPGYSYDVISGDTIRYLTIQTANTNFPRRTMNIAHLNLGQSGKVVWIRDPNNAKIVTHIPDDGALNDAGDLGDFYQWGRVADGHQKIVWKKDSNYIDTITPMTGDANATSALADISGPSSNLDGNGQIKDDGNDYYGKFITPASYWANGNPNNLWGNGSGDNRRTGSDIPLSSPPPPPTTPPTSLWTYQSNNPCPDNWSVPSSWNFFDICNDGNGSTPSTLPTTSNSWSGGVIKGANTWQWWGTSTTNAIGGVIITNADGEKVFLPAAGYRTYNLALLSNAGRQGYYWSNSVNGTGAYYLLFNSGNVYPGNYLNSRAAGFSVRCVSE